MSSRREKIEAMLAQEPGDVFLSYALAMEYEGEGRDAECLAILERLTRAAPPHVPSFFRAAQLLLKLDQIGAARERLRHGIEAARQQGDSHAAGEMAELLASLGSLGE